MSQEIRTAVIAAAGAASRMWPTSKAVPKELYPIGRAPALLHLLDELAQAGIEQVMMVVGPDYAAQMRLLQPGRNPPAKVADTAPVQRLLEILDTLRFAFVFQSGPYGNGTPLLNAMDILGDQPCLYCFCDDVVLGESLSARMLEEYRVTGAPAMAAQPVPAERVHKFGIVECEVVDGHHRIQRLIEKPAPGETPSRLATFGRYVVTPELIAALRETPVGKGSELWFTDAVVRMVARGQPVYATPLTTGHWVTVGDAHGYAEALRVAQELGDACPLF
ncbi:MAG: NTP transferase domain-containing protein [Alphaproteobacteria bacterium]|nr:NTP transferase domain-containing protein [Alphaproteobacteria bacterium]